jgi:hypothetical protein
MHLITATVDYESSSPFIDWRTDRGNDRAKDDCPIRPYHFIAFRFMKNGILRHKHELRFQIYIRFLHYLFDHTTEMNHEINSISCFASSFLTYLVIYLNQEIVILTIFSRFEHSQSHEWKSIRQMGWRWRSSDREIITVIWSGINTGRLIGKE